MKNRIKGCTHHDSKVVQKLAAGGRVGTNNNDPAGPRKDSSGRNASSASAKGAFGGGNSSNRNASPKGAFGGFRQGTNNNDVGPRGGPRTPGLGLTTGKTWTGNTAYGPAGGKAMGFTRSPAEAKARMAAAAQPTRRPETAPPVVTKPTSMAPTTVGQKPRGLSFTYNQMPPKGFKYGNYMLNPTAGANSQAMRSRKSKRNGVLGAGWDERVPADSSRKTTSGVVD